MELQIKERVMVFIDGSNFYHGLKENCGKASIDLLKFGRKVTGEDRDLVRIKYYNSPVHQEDDPQQYRRQQKFFERLRKTPGLDFYLGRLMKRKKKCIHCRNTDIVYVEKGVDIHLATHMLLNAFYDAYDTAILVSGDGDFVVAVNTIIMKGKKVENAYFTHKPRVSAALKKICTKFVPLDGNYLNDCFL